MGAVWARFGVGLGAVCGRFGRGLRLIWGQLWVDLRLVWGRFLGAERGIPRKRAAYEAWDGARRAMLRWRTAAYRPVARRGVPY